MLSTVGRLAFGPAVLLPAVAVRLVLSMCASLVTSRKSAAIPLAATTALAVAVILCMSGTAFARAATNDLLTRLLVFHPRCPQENWQIRIKAKSIFFIKKKLGFKYIANCIGVQ